LLLEDIGGKLATWIEIVFWEAGWIFCRKRMLGNAWQGMRPVYHQKERRVDGHLWITVLAYYLIHNLLYQLRKDGVHDEWRTVREAMRSRIRVSMQAKTREGKTLHVRSTTSSEAVHKKIYTSLGLSSKILRTKKTTI
jgi:transposase